MTSTPEVSHGRGGAGNINPDDTKYVDGEVVRVGAEGSHGDGAFSTGRGGTNQFSNCRFVSLNRRRMVSDIRPTYIIYQILLSNTHPTRTFSG